MAEPSQVPGGYQANTTRQGPLMAIIQIIVAVAIAGGALFFYLQHVNEKKRVAELTSQAREAAKRGDAAAFLEAKKKFIETGKEKEDPAIIAAIAEITSFLYFEYGMKDERTDAQEYVQLSKDKDIQKAERYAAEAYLALGDGQAADAERTLIDLLKRTRHAKLLHALAESKLIQGKAKEAQNAAQEAQKLSSQMVRVPLTSGDALLAQANFGAAKASYQKALLLNGDHLQARTKMLLAQALSGDTKPRLLHKGIKGLRTAAGETPPPRIDALLTYTDGEIFLSEGKAKSALKAADEALAKDPGLVDAYFLKARALAKRKKIKEATVAFNELAKKVPTSLPYALAAFTALDRVEKTKEGVVFLENVAKADPTNGKIYPHLSIAYAKAGDAKKAMEIADKAIEELGNAHDLALFSKARAFQAAGKAEDAQKTYSEAIANHEGGSSNWPEVYFEMGSLRVDEKRYEEAVLLFKQAAAQWEKAKAPDDKVADAYQAAGKALEAQGGRRNKKGAEAFYKKARDVRRGK